MIKVYKSIYGDDLDNPKILPDGGIIQNLESGSGSSSYTLPIASSTVLGGVKIGSGINIAGDGTISVTLPSSYTLPIASSTVLGGVKIGSGLSIDGSGILSATITGGSSNNLTLNTKTINSDYTITLSDSVILINATNNININLPTASSAANRVFYLKKITDSSSNTITIIPNATDKIDSQSSINFNVLFQCLTFISDGTNWFII